MRSCVEILFYFSALLSVFSCVTMATKLSPLFITSPPRVRAWDVRACPLGYIQMSTGTGCRRRRRPAAHLYKGEGHYKGLQHLSRTMPQETATRHTLQVKHIIMRI